MKYHRETCVAWRNRSHPQEVKVIRVKKTLEMQLNNKVQVDRCGECQQRKDRHLPSCPLSEEEQDRQKLLEKHGIPLRLFQALLKRIAAMR
jgi:hypothetical protein